MKENFHLKMLLSLFAIVFIAFSFVKISSLRAVERDFWKIKVFSDPREAFTMLDHVLYKKMQNASIPDEMIPILNVYPDLKKTLIAANIVLPKTDTFVYQGIAVVQNEYIILTAYDAEGKQNSRCYVLNTAGRLLNVARLNSKSHVGGVAFDSQNELLWLPGENGLLHAYVLEDILKSQNVFPEYTFTEVGEDFFDYKVPNKRSIDFLSLEENYLYVGNFSHKRKSSIKKYLIERNGEDLMLSFLTEFKMPAKTQSMIILKRDADKILLSTSSYGRHQDSHILFFEHPINKKVVDYSNMKKKVLTMPPLLEQIAVEQDKLYILFESGAKKYEDCPVRIHTICCLDLNSILE